jgi:hypothetical protein
MPRSILEIATCKIKGGGMQTEVVVKSRDEQGFHHGFKLFKQLLRKLFFCCS